MRNILGTSLVASIFSLVLLTVITQPDLQQSVLFNTKHGSFQKNHCLLQLSCSHSFHSSSLWSFSVPYSSLPSSTTHSFNYEITFFHLKVKHNMQLWPLPQLELFMCQNRRKPLSQPPLKNSTWIPDLVTTLHLHS